MHFVYLIAATPNRPTSPLARLEARKSLLSPSRSCTSPSSQRHLLSPSKESLDVSPSSSARRQSRSPWNLSLSPIPPVDDAKRHYSPKFSPRAPSPLSQSPAASKSPLRAELKSRIMRGFKPLPDDNAINLQTELKGRMAISWLFSGDSFFFIAFLLRTRNFKGGFVRLSVRDDRIKNAHL